MLNSLALIFLAGLSLAAICQRIKLPRIIGMLMTGIILGPFVLNLLHPSMALVVILIKAGLSLNISDLKKVGRPAILMSFLPAVFEILAFVFLHEQFTWKSAVGSVLITAGTLIMVL